jgi:hypothetical protein
MTLSLIGRQYRWVDRQSPTDSPGCGPKHGAHHRGDHGAFHRKGKINSILFNLGWILALAAINPKNLIPTLTAVAAPAIIYLVAPTRSQAILTSWKDCLTAHNRAMTIGHFILLGVLLFAKGIVGLA